MAQIFRAGKPYVFSEWDAGAGLGPETRRQTNLYWRLHCRSIEYGRTDDFCYNTAENPVHLRDLHATMLHILGIEHKQFTYPFLGLDSKLTGVEEAHVVGGILA